MKLSHTTKVTVRKALVALRNNDEHARSTDDPMIIALGASEFMLQREVAEERTVQKAGFHNRTDLEKFARKHNLL